jgi:glutaconate CoA-transferase subunit B
VFRFDPETRELYLAQIHPRVTLEEVRKDIPWDLKVASDLSVTPRPKDEEIDFIRHFNPAMAAGRQLAQDLTVARTMKKAEAKNGKA